MLSSFLVLKLTAFIFVWLFYFCFLNLLPQWRRLNWRTPGRLNRNTRKEGVRVEWVGRGNIRRRQLHRKTVNQVKQQTPQERSPGQDHHLYLFINTPSEILLTYCTETLGAVLRDILHILYDITCIKIDVYCL